MLAKLGVKALIIEGKPEGDKWYSLQVSTDGVTIQEEKELIGKGNFAVVEAVEKRLGGEDRRHHHRPGRRNEDGRRQHLGQGSGRQGCAQAAAAVSVRSWASKKIKFIAMEPTDAKVAIAEPEKFKEANRAFAKALLDHPVSKALGQYGTNVLVNILNEAGGLPTRNFTGGQFEGHEKISGETMHDTIVARGGKPKHDCHPGCVIQCSQIYNDAGKASTRPPALSTRRSGRWAPTAVSTTWTTLPRPTASWTISASTPSKPRSPSAWPWKPGVLTFGDGAGVCRILREEIGKGTALGRIIGNGAGSVGRAYGVTRVPVVKNQAIPAYDPRSVKGIGITYATSTQGADHTMGYTIATNILSVGGTSIR